MFIIKNGGMNVLEKFKDAFKEIFAAKGGESKNQENKNKEDKNPNFMNQENKKVKNTNDAKKKTKGLGSNMLTNLLIVFLVGVLLVIVGSMFSGDKEIKGKDSGTSSVVAVGDSETQKSLNTSSSAVSKEYKEKMESELTSLLEEIEGVGSVHSMIYFGSGQEQVPVFNEETSVSTTNEKDTNGGQREITQKNGGTTVVMENDDNNQLPFITKKNNPCITGICVVAEGAGETITELRIRQAVTKLFGLEDDNVQVYPMKK